MTGTCAGNALLVGGRPGWIWSREIGGSGRQTQPTPLRTQRPTSGAVSMRSTFGSPVGNTANPTVSSSQSGTSVAGGNLVPFLSAARLLPRMGGSYSNAHQGP